MGFWDQTRVAVLGGGGFLGAHVVRALEQRGGRPVVPRTRDGWDFRDRENTVRFMKAARPEVVFQCAANQGGLAYQRRRAVEVLADNLLIAINTFEAAREAGVRKFVNVTASCSYPGDIEGVLREEDYWNGPPHPSVLAYGWARKTSVVLGQAYREDHGLHVIHLVLANLYGPGDHLEPERSHALTAILRRVVEAQQDGRPSVEVWGSGEPVREWLYVEDAAEALVLAAERYEDNALLNVGVGQGICIAELAALVCEVVGYRGSLTFDPSRPDGARRKVLSIQRIQAAIGWAPRTSLREGIARTHEWMKTVLSNKEGAP